MRQNRTPFTHLTVLGACLMAALPLAGCGDDDSEEVMQEFAGTPAGSDGTEATSDPDGAASSTAGVLCDYMDTTFNDSPSVNAESVSTWTCSDTDRTLAANGLPDHPVGTFPNAANPNAITAQDVSAAYTLDPVLTGTATELGGPRGAVGHVLNGVKMDPSTGGSCSEAGECSGGDPSLGWNLEAIGQSAFDFGADFSNAHVQPTGEYHYHGVPQGYLDKIGVDDTAMTLIAWAADGFPIYARYGHSDPTDAGSALELVETGYRTVAEVPASRPPVDMFPLGTFAQDWEYVDGLGDLDECNGRFGVTPEFPGGIHHYFATDAYPYLQRCVTGKVEAGGAPGGPGGQPPGR